MLSIGVLCELHVLSLSDGMAIKRLKLRTNTMPDGAVFINEDAYHCLKKLFEPLGINEKYTQIT